ncbi:hypothetical protein D3C86_1659310 [compost metagenome]
MGRGHGGQRGVIDIDQHGIVLVATGRHQDVAGLQAVGLLLARRLGAKAHRPVNPRFRRGVSHLHHGQTAGIDLRDLAAKRMPRADGGNLVQDHKNLFIANDAVSTVCRI